MSLKTTTLLCIVQIILSFATTATLSQCAGFGYELLSTSLDQLQRDSKLSNETIHQALEQGFNRLLTLLSHCPAAKVDGEYMLRPLWSTIAPFRVYCEYGTYGGDDGSIVIHRRFSGRLSFDRTWREYRNGFGSLQSEYWLGLEQVHQLTRSGNYELTIVLKDDKGVEISARYSRFSIGSEFERYQLRFGGFLDGSAGNGLSVHNGKRFQTVDKTDEGKTCAKIFKSGWWYDNCYFSNLNVLYEDGKIPAKDIWRSLANTTSHITESRMIIKPTF